MIQGLRNLPYHDSLKHFNLPLERLRLHADMIKVFKWVKGYNKADVGKVQTISLREGMHNDVFRSQ